MNYEQLSQDYAKLAREYADLASRCLKEAEERKREHDELRATVLVLEHKIDRLRDELMDRAEKSGRFNAQALIDEDKLRKLQKDDDERQKARAKFWAGLALIVAGIFAGGASTLVWHLVTAEAAHAVPTAH